jgi:hypothetical protein
MDRRSRALEKEIDWVVSHPAQARAWSQSERISAIAMVVTLALGLLVHVLGFAIGSSAISLPGGIPIELAATLVSNLGIVLWTSVVLVIFLDTLPARARRRARTSMALAAKRLETRGLPLPEALADVTAPGIAPRRTDPDQTLRAVLERLTAIEGLLAGK